MKFYKFPKGLMSARAYVSPATGEIVPMNVSAKLILVYMLDRKKFFVDKQSSYHFESQETIGDACALERHTVGRCLKEFVKHGVVKAQKRRPDDGGHLRWFYYDVEEDLDYQ